MILACSHLQSEMLKLNKLSVLGEQINGLSDILKHCLPTGHNMIEIYIIQIKID